VDPKVEKLDKLLKDDNYALASDFAGAAKAIGKPKFDPDAAAASTGDTAGGTRTNAGTGSGGRGGGSVRRLPGAFMPGTLKPLPTIRPRIGPAVMPIAPLPKAGGSNTALIVGGVAAAAVVGFLVWKNMKKAPAA